MQGSWITKETENIYTTKIYKWFKEKYNLKEAFQTWDSKKVPFLFNNRMAIVFYIERGYLHFSIFDLLKKEWFFGAFDPPNNNDKFDFKLYFEKVNKNTIDELGSLELTRYLTFYISFLDEYLYEVILNGDFGKIKRRMKNMNDAQIEDIEKMINDSETLNRHV